jgi:RNA polymerase-binding protein DksA
MVRRRANRSLARARELVGGWRHLSSGLAPGRASDTLVAAGQRALRRKPRQEIFFMQASDLHHYRQILLDLRERLTDGINRLTEAVLADERPAGEHDQLTSEPIDKDVFLDQAEEAIRRKVIEALHRVDLGTYGNCAECGEEIDKERLEAVPYTETCIRCARKGEQRPRTER